MLALLVAGSISANGQADTTLQQFTGKYKFPDGSPVTEITMVIENGLLIGQSTIGNSEFKPTSEADVFEIVAYAGTAIFRRKEGKVVGVSIQVQDTKMEGEKTEMQIGEPQRLKELKVH